MKIEIKNRWDASTIYNGDGEDLKEVLIKAVAFNANLRGANLYCANLGGADLRG